jgi:hypothetical protein
MKSYRTQPSGSYENRGRHILPLFLILTLIGCAIGMASALLRRETGFSIALGDALVIEAIVLFGVAWIGYLKKDGIRFWPRKSVGAGTTQSWKDRVPALGEMPIPPLPPPGDEGPDSPEYQRLAAAEAELRKRIIGGDSENDRENDKIGAVDRRAPAYARSAALAGSILLILGLCFEYIVPGL